MAGFTQARLSKEMWGELLKKMVNHSRYAFPDQRNSRNARRKEPVDSAIGWAHPHGPFGDHAAAAAGVLTDEGLV